MQTGKLLSRIMPMVPDDFFDEVTDKPQNPRRSEGPEGLTELRQRAVRAISEANRRAAEFQFYKRELEANPQREDIKERIEALEPTVTRLLGEKETWKRKAIEAEADYLARQREAYLGAFPAENRAQALELLQRRQELEAEANATLYSSAAAAWNDLNRAYQRAINHGDEEAAERFREPLERAALAKDAQDKLYRGRMDEIAQEFDPLFEMLKKPH